jgi:sulfide:quinone oxidoreductase
MSREPAPHILIAGGGVAAVEALIGLRALLGARPRITLLTPESQLVQRAAAVAAPFGFGPPPALPLADVRRHAHFGLQPGTLAAVQPGGRVAIADDGARIDYDALIVAVGARPRGWLPGAATFAGPEGAAAVGEAVADAAPLVFVVPTASAWSLPAYELAIMASVERRSAGRQPEVTVVTPEPAPLWIFGEQAEAAIRELLAHRGVGLRTSAQAAAVREGELELVAGPAVAARWVVALPRQFGPAIAGLPCDRDGFIPVDAHGRVAGVEDVWAAGDATTFPLKQGGLATQQADAVVEMLAAELGASVRPRPFRPVLRGLLLTGGAPLYLRSRLGASGEPQAPEARRARGQLRSRVSGRALWWPPGKIAGRYLAPLLATARPPVLTAAPLQDLASGPPADDREEALELALLLAEEDAALGDYPQALYALDAAAALSGGVLPGEWEERRTAWRSSATWPRSL